MIVCFFGDSLTLGYGDEAGLGWPGRITAALRAGNIDATGYNLGIRKDTTLRVQERWRAAALIRRMDGVPFKLTFSLGVADIMNAVPAADSAAAASDILIRAKELGDVLFVGPTPVLDEAKCAAIADRSTRFQDLCNEQGIPFIETIDAMRTSPVYMQALKDGDAVHPTANGYAALSEHITHNEAARAFFGLE